jgi:hypothetical protein
LFFTEIPSKGFIKFGRSLMKTKLLTCFAGRNTIFQIITILCVADVFAQMELFINPNLTKEKSINQSNSDGFKIRPEFKRARKLSINWNAFNQKTIILNLFDDTKFTAKFKEIYKGDTSDYEAKEIWVGEVENKPLSNVHIYKYGKYITGRISVDGKLFGLVDLDNGIIQVTEFDISKIMSEGDDILLTK